jgi:hypothetical protein
MFWKKKKLERFDISKAYDTCKRLQEEKFIENLTIAEMQMIEYDLHQRLTSGGHGLLVVEYSEGSGKFFVDKNLE